MKMKRLMALVLLLVSLLILPAFSEKICDVERIIIKTGKITIGVGEKVSMDVETVPSDAVKTLEFSSSRPRVAEIGPDGIVTGLKKGSAKITVSAPNGISASVKVKVFAAPTKVKLALDKKIVGVGETIGLKVSYNSGAAGSYTLKSSDNSIARIEDGAIKSISPGKVKITARAYNGKKKSVTLTVKKAPDSIAFSPKSVTMGAQQICQTACILSPDSAAAIAYTTSNSSVARIDSNGLITALNPGNAEITARTHNGLSAKLPVTVCPAPEKITLPDAEIIMGLGNKHTLAPSASPSDAITQYTYSSKKSAIATVSKEGVVKAVAHGTTKITVKSHNGKKATVKITVAEAPTSVKPTLSRTTLGVGEIIQAGARFNDGGFGGVTFSCRSQGIISVDKNGLVKAIAPGSAKLIARCENGVKGSIKVTVKPAPDKISPVSQSYKTGVGAEIFPEIRMPAGTAGSISYESLSPDIAAINPATGAVNGVSTGVASVRAIAHNGVKCDISVTVLPAPQSITLTESAITLFEGKTHALNHQIAPSDAYAQYTVTSSDEKVVKITSSGIKAVSHGTAVVTFTTYNGKSASCTVTVPKSPGKITLKRDFASIKVGDTFTLRYTLPKNTHTEVTFTSSDESIASVTPSGLVTGVGAGTALITARTLNGKEDVCMVSVESETAPVTNGKFEITFMNIGRNDGILIQCGDEAAFVDSGMHSYGLQAVRYMKNHDVTHLKYYIGTHAHRDHVGGAAAILAAIETDMVIMPHDGVRRQIINCAATEAEERAANKAVYQEITLGESFWLGGAKFECLGPVKILDVDPSEVPENANSLVLKVTYGINTFLLTADSTGGEISEIHAKNPGCLSAQVLKNPHHNGKAEFLAKKCSPEITVFSTSSNYLPTRSYQEFLIKRGSRIYITSSNRHGHVRIISDGTELTVRTQN